MPAHLPGVPSVRAASANHSCRNPFGAQGWLGKHHAYSYSMVQALLNVTLEAQ